jgi:mono/diheme cytochrome c family protein
MIRPLLNSLLLVLAMATSAGTHAQTTPPPSRGQLLSGTHCVTCHTQQVHWRQARAVRSWNDPIAQVKRWQGVANLACTQDDINQVARYLNDTIYRFPQAGKVAKRE